MCRLIKLFIVMVSLMMLNFSFAEDKDFVFYKKGNFPSGMIIKWTPLILGCLDVDRTKKKQIGIGDICVKNNSVFNVPSWSKCQETCSKWKGDNGGNKCIAFVTGNKHDVEGETSCQLYRDVIMEKHKVDPVEYLYYDKSAVTLLSKVNRPRDEDRFQDSAKTEIVMFNKVHQGFFNKEINNTFGRLVKISEMKNLKIVENSKAMTLVCENPLTLKGLKASEAKLIQNLHNNRTFINESSECGNWIVDELMQESDLFTLNDGTESQLGYEVDESNGDHYISFRCDNCHKDLWGNHWVLTLSLQLYLKKYYNETLKKGL